MVGPRQREAQRRGTEGKKGTEAEPRKKESGARECGLV